MKLIPAVDIKNGACVRLYQGDFDEVTVYGDDPAAVARQFAELKPALLQVCSPPGATTKSSKSSNSRPGLAALNVPGSP